MSLELLGSNPILPSGASLPVSFEYLSANWDIFSPGLALSSSIKKSFTPSGSSTKPPRLGSSLFVALPWENCSSPLRKPLLNVLSL